MQKRDGFIDGKEFPVERGENVCYLLQAPRKELTGFIRREPMYRP